MAHIHISKRLVRQGARTWSCPKSETLNQRTRQRGAATCHSRCHSPHPPPQKKRPPHNTNLALCCKSLVLWKNSGNNLLRALLNIPWRSSSPGGSIFYHKASRKTSASERILAELGTFQGPGLRGPFGLCRVSGILFIEAPMPSLLPTSLE